MNRFFKFFATTLLALLPLATFAQTQKELRLNEYLLYNTDDYEDDFGQKSAWFEIFNTGYGAADIGGCFLTDDASNLTKYAITRADVNTKVKSRQSLLFFADGKSERGTFHVNFTLNPGKEIILVSSDGKTIIDRIRISDGLKENQSYGRLQDGVGSCGPNADGSGWAIMETTSPRSNNAEAVGKTKAARMLELDPYGWIMAITAMSVVFIALIILCFAFKLVARINKKVSQRGENREQAPQPAAIGAVVEKEDASGEINAAIAMALHLYFEDEDCHDNESFVLTIEDRSNGSWNSKSEVMLQMPRN